MTEAEAIKELRYSPFGIFASKEACELAINALEKQIPKKPIIKPWCPAICPCCGENLSEYLGDGYYSHRTFLERCTDADCSQRLDWSDVDD